MSQVTVESTRDRILAEALALFASKGYDATSMREIAEQVGLTKAALYYHFTGKETIAAALLGDFIERVRDLSEWARAHSDHDLAVVRSEVLTRWADVVQAQGLQLSRFIAANRTLLGQLPNIDLRAATEELQTILAPPQTSVEDRLRVRMSLASIHLASIFSVGIDAAQDDILAAARAIALDLMPADRRRSPTS